MPTPAPTPIVAPGKPLALLTYLALAPRRSASREFLLDLLWADMDGDRGRHALRQTFWQLRQLLGESAFEGREEMRLALPLQIDRDIFLEAVEAGDLEAAVSHYTGHFLPGFAAPGGVEFEQWADRERDRLRNLFIRAADTLARRQLSRGKPRDAVALARRIREAEPLAEGGWRLLLEALHAAQDRVQELVEADALEALLRQEGRDPEPATIAALRRARQKTDVGTDGAQPTIMAELVGREREFSTLTQAWGQARHRSVHVLLAASAGLGKTRLLQDFHARLKTLGARAILVRANPGERDLPFALAADLAGALGELPGAAAVAPATAATLVALNPALSAHFGAAVLQAPGTDQVLQRTIAIAELISAVAYESPLAILVDDLHWADPASLRVLNAVRARLVESRVLIVTATRPNRDHVRESGDVTVLNLAPLTLAEVGALVSSIARPPAGPDGEFLITTLWRASGGSPLHVLEALQQVLDAGHLQLSETAWKIVDLNRLVDEVSRGESIAGRIKSLDRPASYLLTLLATAGAPCSTDLLMGAAARESSGLTEALNRLERRGFITQVRGEWEPAHDEIADAALEVARPATRQAAARALGEALAGGDRCDSLTLRRALQLLIQGGDTDRLAAVLVRHAPEVAGAPSGSQRHALVADLLGLPGDDDVVRQVLEGLPVERRGARMTGWAAAIAVVAFALVSMVWPPASPEEVAPGIVAITRTPEGKLEVRSANLRPSDLILSGAVSLGRAVFSSSSALAHPSAGELAVGRGGWVLYHPPMVDNTRTNDIGRTTEKGTAYLSAAERDDIYPRVSPDRSLIAFATTRWSPRGLDDLDIAIMDSTGNHLRQLTAGPPRDVAPTWDPSGTRLAFVRKYRVIRPDELCVITVEGVLLACHVIGGFDPDDISGWIDANTVALRGPGMGGMQSMRLNLLTGLLGPFVPGNTPELKLSPNARWVLCRCDLLESEEPRWRIFPAADPSSDRLIALPEGHVLELIGWNSALPAWEQAIASLRIVNLPTAIPLQASHVPRVEALNASGTRVPFPHGVLRWWASDTTILRVDPATGAVTPLREGAAELHVTAGGWRTTSSPVTARGSAGEVVLEESWNALSSARWRPYGDPWPRLAVGPDDVRGMLPNGDGSNPSGLYSEGRWVASDGIGVEVALSTPIDRTMWQNLGLTISSDAHDATLAGWDHRAGIPPATAERQRMECGVGYPAGEGATSVQRMMMSTPREFRYHPADATLRTGAWWRVRLQLFPDGSCGVAVNDQAVWRSAPALPTQDRYRIWLVGNSVGARTMFGPLSAWTGVRPGVDWASLDSIPAPEPELPAALQVPPPE